MNTQKNDCAESFGRSLLASVAASLVLLGLSGCGNSNAGEDVTTFAVKGKVLLPDGKPLTEGTVTFVPQGEQGRQAVGTIQPDGSFQMTTIDPNDGVAEGTYNVRIASTLSIPGARSNQSRPLVPTHYQDETSSGLTVNVTPQSTDLDPFKLSLKPPVLQTADRGRGR